MTAAVDSERPAVGVSAQHGADQQALSVLADAQPSVRMATSRQAVSEVPMAMAQVPARAKALAQVPTRALGVALVSGLPAQFVLPPVLALAEPVPVPVAGEEAGADAPV